MSAEEVGLAALLRPLVLLVLLWIVYKLVILGARYLPEGSELRRICDMTIDRSNQRAASNQQQQAEQDAKR